MSGPELNVASEELRAAATAVTAAAEQVACWTLPAADTGGFGSPELATAFGRMARGAEAAVRAGQDSARAHADSLRSSASLYDLLDTSVASDVASLSPPGGLRDGDALAWMYGLPPAGGTGG